jgi:hypothetical protein
MAAPSRLDWAILLGVALSMLVQNTWDTTKMRNEQRAALSNLNDATSAVVGAVAAVDRGVDAVRDAVAAMDRTTGKWSRIVVVATLAGAALGAVLTWWLKA